MPGRSPAVTITVLHHQILRELSQTASVPGPVRQRAQVILLAFERKQNSDIAEQVGMHRNQVGQWRKRWIEAFDHLVDLECAGDLPALRHAILGALSDAPRSGRPPSRTAPQ